MNISQIETNIQQLIQSFNKHTFIYDMLLAYDMPKASVTRLQQGNLNLSKVPGEIAWKKKLFFKEAGGEDLHVQIDAIQSNERALKHDPRFLIVTDYETLLAVDRKTSDTLDIPILEIAKHFDFFLPWAGMEKTQHQSENPADVKAAEKMARLYDEIKKDNPTTTPEAVHNLNIFLSRLLFCFFAEDTGIFPKKGMFTNAISSHTQPDGSDLNTYLDNLFKILNTEEAARDNNLAGFLNAFPYVNGGLFRNPHQAPVFTRRSRQLVIECGSLQWKDIHPDIFGSMIQAVISPEDRGGWGMHYTSVPNIMKVIEPLFLNELNEEFEAAKYEPKRLNKLLERLSHIKIFDPACGSGNFLIIAYKELRLLEIKILQRLQELQKVATGFEPKQLELIPKQQLTLAASYQLSLFTRVELSQFYGIELDDFAHEIATLSLWLAQHQMNMKFKEVFGAANPTLPLQAGGNIVHDNATRINWEKVCPKVEGDDIYILGNPPYLGQRNQKKVHQDDMDFAFHGQSNYKNLDYISIWFFKASLYIQQNIKVAFVTTNSLCQGTQVEMLWPLIIGRGVEIFFAFKNIKWTNNAKNKAGVTVSIIGLRLTEKSDKYLYDDGKRIKVANINPYLIPGNNIIISNKKKPISELGNMEGGNQPREGGHLILDDIEKKELLRDYPEIKKFIRPLCGSNEFLYNLPRWCIWIYEDQVEEAIKIAPIRKRVELIRELRKNGNTLERNFVNVPYRFIQNNEAKKNQLIIPVVSSENREYIPIGFLDAKTIILNSANAIFDPETFVFAVISSSIHNIWVKAVAGKLENRIRYTTGVCFNAFPFPLISEAQKKELEYHTFQILTEREKYSEKTLAELYDTEKMPAGLKEAHQQLDLAVERCYRSKPFETDEERLEYLFKLYEQMIAAEKARNGEITFEQTKTKKQKNTYA